MKVTTYIRLLAVLLALMLAFTGCTAAPRPREEDDREDEEYREDDDREDDDREDDDREDDGGSDDLEAVCRAFFDAYAALDGETVGAMLTGMGNAYAFGDLTGLLAQRIRVDIGSATREEGYALVPVEIENVDLAAVMANVPEDLADEEAASQWLAAELAGEDVPMKTYPVDVVLLRQNGSWKIELTGPLADALLGGYFSMIEQAAGEAAE